MIKDRDQFQSDEEYVTYVNEILDKHYNESIRHNYAIFVLGGIVCILTIAMIVINCIKGRYSYVVSSVICLGMMIFSFGMLYKSTKSLKSRYVNKEKEPE